MDKKQQQANVSAGYGPDNPEPLSFHEAKVPKDKDALHSAMEYISGNNGTSAGATNKTEP